jgi:hypothetical protein
MKYTPEDIKTVSQWLAEWEVDLNDRLIDFEELAKQLFDSEDNYNNADITSGQICYSENEILQILTQIQELNG